MAVIHLHRYLRGRRVDPDPAVLGSFLGHYRLRVRQAGDGAGGVLMVNEDEPLSLGGRPLPFRLDLAGTGGAGGTGGTDPGTATGGCLLAAELSPQEASFLFKLCHITGLLAERVDTAPAFVAIESVHRTEDLPAAEGTAVTWVSTPARFRHAVAGLAGPAGPGCPAGLG
ncbi:hypothetical protein [Corynebacterium halotolerans]|uniref:Uncharacterized protein n=1 Tax=Corynebacterium halotolerans YIM 70093 = DSM 44683 TaxID=1121362 RepID=M1P999_9CORY|nr:hypothetical protein [Corynebacterium halotolerans]AGF73256.1 hypothetical protein A605_11280 [Corynebacterium halotolerans YIM 70093 = DSM 44683]